jgi:uncharacterized protein YceK
MKRRRSARLIATSVCLLGMCGCASIITLGEPKTKNKVFSGTIRHIELKCGHAVCLDMPFSLVADTVLLPVTIPWTAYNFAEVDENQPPTEQNGRDNDRDINAQPSSAPDRQ